MQLGISVLCSRNCLFRDVVLLVKLGSFGGELLGQRLEEVQEAS